MVTTNLPTDTRSLDPADEALDLKATNQGMIQRVGQRFVAANGLVFEAIRCDGTPGHCWALRELLTGHTFWFDPFGVSNISNIAPKYNLVSILPGEQT